VLCERCGSINVVRTQSSNFDKVVRWLTGRKRFTCKRCGWSALKNWYQPPSEGVRPPRAKLQKKLDTADDFDMN
jgi:hypothetical protein